MAPADTATQLDYRNDGTRPYKKTIGWGAAVELLQEHVAGRTFAGERVFQMTRSHRTAEMLREDLEAARIPVKTDDGVIDFHSLRHTMITRLARSGVHPKVAQELARHSTITLTMDVYSHVAPEEQVRAIESLPELAVTPQGEGVVHTRKAQVGAKA